MRKKILGTLLVLTLVAGAGGAWYYRQVYKPARFNRADPAALVALRSDARVAVEWGEWIVLSPIGPGVDTGFIFYPGAECDPAGYAEPLRAVAESGYLVVIVPMPFSLATFAPDRAADVMAAYPGIRHWFVGGHSLGGVAAARFVYRHPGAVAGLLLWDAYPATTDDISRRTLAVRQIHRLEPNGLAPSAYLQRNYLLPPQTDFTPIAGATHINFGRFIPSARFAAEHAAIPIEEQHRRIAASTVDFLSQLRLQQVPPADR